MKLTLGDFFHLSMYLESFLFGELYVLQLRKPCLKDSNHFISGIYSGIFALYLQCHASKERTGDNTKQKLTFYALCVLYILSAAAFALDIADACFDLFVSIMGFFFLTLR